MSSWWPFSLRQTRIESTAVASNTQAPAGNIWIDKVLVPLVEVTATVLIAGAITLYIAGAQSKADSINKISCSKEIAKRLKRSELDGIPLTDHEARIALDAVSSVDEMTATFADIGGMERELGDVTDNIIVPLKLWKEIGGMAMNIPFPSGVLLYGKPGTGKSLTARALAKECGATFLNINSSMLLDKFLGESDKLVMSMFSLARKLAPTIIFLDEAEAIFRKRTSNGENGQLIGTLQSVFLQEWDGLKSSTSGVSKGNVQALTPVVVLAATNRPMDIDAAFLRRMPVTIRTSMPTVEQRADILGRMLLKTKVEEGVDVKELAMATDGFSGSELRELVRVAGVSSAKRHMAAVKAAMNKPSTTAADLQQQNMMLSDSAKAALRALEYANLALSAADFEHALRKTQVAADIASEYAAELNLESYDDELSAAANLYKKIVEKSANA